MTRRSVCERENQRVRGIAHDLNNLLTVIGGDCLDGLASSQPGNDRLLVALDRAKQLVGRLFREPEGDRYSDVSNVLNELRPTLESLLPASSQLRIELQQGLPKAFVTAHELEQVVVNLVLNAAEAVGQGEGEVVLTVRATPRSGKGWVLISVEDSGPGIDPADVSRVFEDGFTTKDSTGLGLALARQTVERLGGSIEVRSSPQGTKFEVFLHRQDDHTNNPFPTDGA